MEGGGLNPGTATICDACNKEILQVVTRHGMQAAFVIVLRRCSHPVDKVMFLRHVLRKEDAHALSDIPPGRL